MLCVLYPLPPQKKEAAAVLRPAWSAPALSSVGNSWFRVGYNTWSGIYMNSPVSQCSGGQDYEHSSKCLAGTGVLHGVLLPTPGVVSTSWIIVLLNSGANSTQTALGCLYLLFQVVPWVSKASKLLSNFFLHRITGSLLMCCNISDSFARVQNLNFCSKIKHKNFIKDNWSGSIYLTF